MRSANSIRSKQDGGEAWWRRLSRQEVFSTGDVARICHVSVRIAGKWIDTNKIKGYRLPAGSTDKQSDRRVTRKEMLAFLRQFSFPIPAWLAHPVLIAATGRDQDFAALLEWSGRCGEVADGLFGAGWAAALSCPATALAGPLWGQAAQADAVRTLTGEGTAVLALEAEDAEPGLLAKAGAAVVLPVGLEAGQVVAKLLKLAGEG